MEQLNRIELIGIIGTVNTTTVSNTKVARMSVATNVAFKNRQDESVIETTWHSVTAWQSPKFPDLDSLKKGQAIHIIGRLRRQYYSASDGTERYTYEILAQSVEILTDQLTIQINGM